MRIPTTLGTPSANTNAKKQPKNFCAAKIKKVSDLFPRCFIRNNYKKLVEEGNWSELNTPSEKSSNDFETEKRALIADKTNDKLYLEINAYRPISSLNKATKIDEPKEKKKVDQPSKIKSAVKWMKKHPFLTAAYICAAVITIAGMIAFPLGLILPLGLGIGGVTLALSLSLGGGGALGVGTIITGGIAAAEDCERARKGKKALKGCLKKNEIPMEDWYLAQKLYHNKNYSGEQMIVDGLLAIKRLRGQSVWECDRLTWKEETLNLRTENKVNFEAQWNAIKNSKYVPNCNQFVQGCKRFQEVLTNENKPILSKEDYGHISRLLCGEII